MAGPGHNGQLKAFVERIERLQEEKKTLGVDIKEVYAEAKSAGFDAKILRKAVKYRATDAAKRDEENALLETYLYALGDYVKTPLGKAAVDRVSTKG